MVDISDFGKFRMSKMVPLADRALSLPVFNTLGYSGPSRRIRRSLQGLRFQRQGGLQLSVQMNAQKVQVVDRQLESKG